MGSRDPSTYTSIWHAVDADDVSDVALLVKKGCDVNERRVYENELQSMITHRGETPLCFAARRGQVKMVNILLLYGADLVPSGCVSPLIQAIFACQLRVVYELLNFHETDPETRAQLETLYHDVTNGTYGNYPIHCAILSTSGTDADRLNIVKFLIDRRVCTSVTNSDSNTPLDLVEQKIQSCSSQQSAGLFLTNARVLLYLAQDARMKLTLEMKEFEDRTINIVSKLYPDLPEFVSTRISFDFIETEIFNKNYYQAQYLFKDVMKQYLAFRGNSGGDFSVLGNDKEMMRMCATVFKLLQNLARVGVGVCIDASWDFLEQTETR